MSNAKFCFFIYMQHRRKTKGSNARLYHMGLVGA